MLERRLESIVRSDLHHLPCLVFVHTSAAWTLRRSLQVQILADIGGSKMALAASAASLWLAITSQAAKGVNRAPPDLLVCIFVLSPTPSYSRLLHSSSKQKPIIAFGNCIVELLEALESLSSTLLECPGV